LGFRKIKCLKMDFCEFHIFFQTYYNHHEANLPVLTKECVTALPGFFEELILVWETNLSFLKTYYYVQNEYINRMLQLGSNKSLFCFTQISYPQNNLIDLCFSRFPFFSITWGDCYKMMRVRYNFQTFLW